MKRCKKKEKRIKKIKKNKKKKKNTHRWRGRDDNRETMPTKKMKNETIHAGKNEKKKKQIRTGGEGEIAGIVKRKKKK